MIAAAAMACLLGAGHPAAASPCNSAARVAGSSDLAVALRAALAARGIDTTGDGHCTPARVSVARDHDRSLLLTITMPDGQRVTRRASNPSEAATIVATWVDRELDAPLLQPRDLPAPPVVAHPDLDDEAPPTLTAPASPAPMPLPPGRRVTVRVATAGVVASDGSLWAGVHGGACVAFGRTCIGASALWITDTGVAGDSEAYETGRSAVDMFVTVDLPLRYGRLTLTPAVGIGLGTMQMSRAAGSSASGDGDQLIQDERGGPCLFGQVEAGLPLSDRLRLTGALALGASPTARSQPFMDETVPIAGEPRVYLWTSLGLRFGAL